MAILKPGLLDTTMTFIIPVFNNMPEIPSESPSINSNDFIQENQNVYCNASNVNIRTGPSTSYEVITKVNNNDKMTRIAKGKQAGERWDKVILENGIVGYIYQTYVTETPEMPENPEIQVTGITLDHKEIYMQIGDTFILNAEVEPEDADNKEVLYSSKNHNIATVQENGIVVAKEEGETIIIASSKENEEIKAECKVTVVRKMEDSEIHFDSSLNVNSFEISGIDYKNNTVADIKQKITTDLKIEFVNNKNEILQDSDLVGTGTKIRVIENDKILREYTIILYGDVNGDGKINSVDLLVLQRHILEISPIEEIYKKAANVRKSGSKPTSVDLLLIQRHILRLQIINQ